MSITHINEIQQYCEECGSQIYAGSLVEVYEDLVFCEEYCIKEFLYEEFSVRVEVTDDNIFRSVD